MKGGQCAAENVLLFTMIEAWEEACPCELEATTVYIAVSSVAHLENTFTGVQSIHVWMANSSSPIWLMNQSINNQHDCYLIGYMPQSFPN